MCNSVKIISKRILNENDRDDDIILEFMSKPEERLLIDTEYMNTYYVDYLSFFDEKDNDLQKGKYSLIIMNTCPFVGSPHLNNENVVKKLTEVLIPNGYILCLLQFQRIHMYKLTKMMYKLTKMMYKLTILLK
jgi:hypothetical protein